MAKKGKIDATAQLLQNIRSGKDAPVVDKAAVENKYTEVAGPRKNIPDKIAVEHSFPDSEDTLSGDKSPPKKSTVMKTVSSKKVGWEENCQA